MCRVGGYTPDGGGQEIYIEGFDRWVPRRGLLGDLIVKGVDIGGGREPNIFGVHGVPGDWGDGFWSTLTRSRRIGRREAH